MKLRPPLSKQTVTVYSLLLEKGALNAKEIGKELHILPQAVYRSLDTLLTLGCIYRVNGQYPDRFMGKPVLSSVETFSLIQREWFLNTFAKNGEKNCNGINGHLSMSFIENRTVMFEKSLIDMQKATREVNLLISGDGPPPEIMLENKRMIERGVVIRMLVQKSDNKNKQLLESWKKIGIQVRVRELVSSRIFTIDNKIVYFMSYDPNDKNKSVGMRFEYAPMGQLMNTLFMHMWQKGKKV